MDMSLVPTDLLQELQEFEQFASCFYHWGVMFCEGGMCLEPDKVALAEAKAAFEREGCGDVIAEFLLEGRQELERREGLEELE